MRIIDLSHSIEHGRGAYPGLPEPSIRPHIAREDSHERYGGLATFQIDAIAMVGNTGTYLDAPFHRDEHGVDMSAIDLARHAGIPGVVVRVPDSVRSITPDVLPAVFPRGAAVLFATGWDRRYGTAEYAADAPFLHADCARTLVGRGAVLVGIDGPNLDDIGDLARPAHTILLRSGVGIVEHLRNLDALDGEPFAFFAVPPALKRVGSFPVRAFALFQ
jgi:kynurenine formamidase